VSPTRSSGGRFLASPSVLTFGAYNVHADLRPDSSVGLVQR
jgi:hypothetical protein